MMPGLLPGAKSALVELESFRFMRSAVPQQQTAGDGFYAITLDADCFEHIQNLNSDLRIIDQDGNLVSWILHKVTAEKKWESEKLLSGKIVREQTLPDGKRNVIFELDGTASLISAIELVGGKIDPGTVLTVAVGDGQNNWQTAVNQLQLSNTANLPETINRRFPLSKPLNGKAIRLTWEKGKINALEAVRVFTVEKHQRPDSPVSAAYPVSVLSRKQEKSTAVIVCKSAALPLTQLKMTSTAPIYLHRVTVYGSNDRRNWQPVTTGSIRKIDLDRSDTVDFPENRWQFLQIQIENSPANQLNNWHISVVGNCYNWLLPGKMVKRNEKPVFTVFYGATTALSPMDISQANYNNQDLTECRLAVPQPNALRRTGVNDRSSWHHLVGASIVALAGVAIIAVFIATLRSKDILPAD